MIGEKFTEFAEWADNHGWHDFAGSEENGVTHHFFTVPTSSEMVEVLEADDKVLAIYSKRVVEDE